MVLQKSTLSRGKLKFFPPCYEVLKASLGSCGSNTYHLIDVAFTISSTTAASKKNLDNLPFGHVHIALVQLTRGT